MKMKMSSLLGWFVEVVEGRTRVLLSFEGGGTWVKRAGGGYSALWIVVAPSRRANALWYSGTNYFSELNRIDGKPIEFEWKIFPGFTIAGILNEIQKMMRELQCDPADFKYRIIFMSTFNDIVWDAGGNDELCEKWCRIRTTISSRSLVFPGAWIRKEVFRNWCTHSVSHAHFSDTVSLRDVQTSRTRRAQGVCSAHVKPLHLALSIFSCFIRLLCCSRTVTLTPRSRLHLPCRTVPDPKARVQRTSARAVRSLASWLIPRTQQVMRPRSST